MADISKIKLPGNDTAYDVKDSNARERITALEQGGTGTGKADLTTLASAFSTSTAYGVGDYVTYNGLVYRCTDAHSASAWNSSHFTEVKAVGQYVTAGKKSGTTLGNYATAEGRDTTASGWGSHAEGRDSKATGYCTHAEGFQTVANHLAQHVFGEFNIADTNAAAADALGDYVEIVGNGTADNARSNARTLDWSGNEQLQGALYVEADTTTSTLDENNRVATLGVFAPAFSAYEGYSVGDYVTYDGKVYRCKTTHGGRPWNNSHFVEVKAVGQYVTSGRKSDTALGKQATAEGMDTTASGNYSHAEGYQTITSASGLYSHAEGYQTTASNAASHAEGSGTTASGPYTHAEGEITTASGNSSHAEGSNTTANHKSQHVFGEFNVLDTNAAAATARGDYVEIVGNGTSTSARSNARTLDWNGNEVLSGSLTATKVNAVSNENLLRNWYFVGGGSQQGGKQFPINSRKSTSVTYGSPAGYFIDGWKLSFETGTLLSDGVQLSPVTGNLGFGMLQLVGDDVYNSIVGKQVTLSMILTENVDTVHVMGFTANTSNIIGSFTGTGLKSITFTVPTTSDVIRRYICFRVSGGSATITAVKLEIGNQQTLAHYENGAVVLNDVPDYEYELFKCQTTTTGDADTYANHRNLVEGMARSNHNYIRNWYFIGGGSQQGQHQFPINSRGKTSYTRNEYAIDCWYLSYGSNYNYSLDIGSNGLTLSHGSTGSTSFQQYIPEHGVLSTTVCTISAIISGELYSVTIYPFNSGSPVAFGPFGLYTLPVGTIIIRANPNASGVISAVKLETGTTQTLARKENGSWVINDIPDYEQELFRCQTLTNDSNDIYANKRNLVEGMARPNENLLDNWYFVGGGTGYGVFPVNQRYPQTSWTNIASVKGTIDRWGCGGNKSTIQSLSDGMSVAKGTSSSKGEFVQIVDSNPNNFLSKTYTISLLYNDGGNDKLIFVSGVIPSTVDVSANVSWIDFGDRTNVNIRIGWWTGHGVYVTLENYSNDAIVFKAAKLERGTIQTLAHQENGVWVLNEIPSYDEELRKCQAYLQIIKPTGTEGCLLGSGYVDSGTNAKRALFTVPLSAPMRPITSVTSTGVGVIQTGVGNKTIEAIALFCQTSTLATLNATLTTAISSPSYAALTAYVLNSGSVTISAEL